MSYLRSFGRGICAAVLLALGVNTSADAGIYSQTISSGPGIGVFNSRPFAVDFTFTGLPTIAGDGLLTVTATGDIGGNGEYVRVDDYNGTALGFVFGDNLSGAEPLTFTDSLLIPQASLVSAIQGDTLTLSFVDESSFPTAYATFNSLALTAPTATIPEPETDALMLTGLTMLGFVARRRKLKLAAAA